MALHPITAEVEKIDRIAPILEQSLGQRVADLAPEILKQLRSIRLAPKLTSSGLEPINPIVDWILYTRYVAKEFLETGDIAKNSRQLTKRK